MIKSINDKTQWHLTTWMLVCLFIYNILDFQTTYIALSQGMTEANPIVNWFLEISGTIWVILWIKLVVYGHIFGQYWFIPKYKESCQKVYMQWTFGACLVLYIGVVIHNLYKISNFPPV